MKNQAFIVVNIRSLADKADQQMIISEKNMRYLQNLREKLKNNFIKISFYPTRN